MISLCLPFIGSKGINDSNGYIIKSLCVISWKRLLDSITECYIILVVYTCFSYLCFLHSYKAYKYLRH